MWKVQCFVVINESGYMLVVNDKELGDRNDSDTLRIAWHGSKYIDT